MYRRGFTIVELVIVITIMGILLVLGVVNLRGAQANARDDERKTDIETIAVNLENYFISGTEGSTVVGRYPSLGLFTPSNTVLFNFRDADSKTFIAPGAADLASSFIGATNTTESAAGVLPRPGTNQYVYQPLQPDGSLCTAGIVDCRRYNLYYKLENATTDCPAPDNLCMYLSKNQ